MSTAAASRTPARVAVMGAGSWGTAFALVVCDAGNQVTLWARRPELADKINFEHCNTDYFPDLRLPESLQCGQRPARSHAGGRLRGARGAVAVVAGQPASVADSRNRHRGELGERNRARQRVADERGGGRSR